MPQPEWTLNGQNCNRVFSYSEGRSQRDLSVSSPIGLYERFQLTFVQPTLAPFLGRTTRFELTRRDQGNKSACLPERPRRLVASHARQSYSRIPGRPPF